MVTTARFEIMNPFLCANVDGVYNTCVYINHLLEGLFVCLFQGVQVALWHDIQVICFHRVELRLGSSWAGCKNSISTAVAKLSSVQLMSWTLWRETAALRRRHKQHHQLFSFKRLDLIKYKTNS